MRSRVELLRPVVTHPTVLVLAALAVALAALFREALLTPAGVLAVGVGLLLFVPQEYVSHRFFLHARPSRRPFLRRMQERLHYGHHRDPSDVPLIFGPLWSILPLAALYWLLYLAVVRDVALASLVTLGNVVAYVYYEYSHYVAHSPIVPLTRWGKRLKALHLLHHHKNEHYWFGVTTRAGDVVAGTYAEPQAVPMSPTARDIAREH